MAPTRTPGVTHLSVIRSLTPRLAELGFCITLRFAQGSGSAARGRSGGLQGRRRETGLALSCLFPSASCGLPVSASSIPAATLCRWGQCQLLQQLNQCADFPALAELVSHPPVPGETPSTAGTPAQRSGPRHLAPSSEAWLSALQGSSVLGNCPLAPQLEEWGLLPAGAASVPPVTFQVPS